MACLFSYPHCLGLTHSHTARSTRTPPLTAVDPFGHSAFQASVLSGPSAGFNSVFFMRADWQEIAQRQNHTTTEFVWAPSPSLGPSGATFGGILYGGYCTVPGLSRSFWSNDAPIRDSPYLEDDNVAAVVNATVATVLAALAVVPQGGPGQEATRDIMLPLGCDFEWENAGSWCAFLPCFCQPAWHSACTLPHSHHAPAPQNITAHTHTPPPPKHS